MRLYFK